MAPCGIATCWWHWGHSSARELADTPSRAARPQLGQLYVTFIGERNYQVGAGRVLRDPPVNAIHGGSRGARPTLQNYYRGYTLSADSSRPVSSPMKTPRTAT